MPISDSGIVGRFGGPYAAAGGPRRQPITAAQLEIAAHGTTAVLAIWLGLTVITRAQRAPAAVVFAVLCGLLGTWSVAILGERLTTDAAVAETLNRIENAAAYVIPAVTLHVALVFTLERPPSRAQAAAVGAAYAISLVMAGIALAAPEQSWNVTAPGFDVAGVPEVVFGWAWIGARLAMLGLAVAWLVAAFNRAGLDRARRQQLGAAVATIAVGAVGGALRIVSSAFPTEPWIGVLLIAAALVTTAYAVFAQGVFLAPVVAGRAFLYSVVIGLGMTVFIGLVIGLDELVRRSLSVEIPIVAGLALVAAIALFDPLAERVRRLVGRADYSGSAERLQRALDNDRLTAQTPGQAIEPALARLVRTFRLRGAAVVAPDATTRFQVGEHPGDDPGRLRIPLRPAGDGEEAHGEVGSLVVSGKRNHLPFTAQEMTLLGDGARFIADLVELNTQQSRQARALADLSRRRAGVDSRGRELSEALGAAAGAGGGTGLHVYALGPLRVERDGALITRWGGEKAGSRQAEAIFAFLFDRGERGASKDEMVELIWPDVDLERADLAFHRTLGGLRTVLEPGRRARDRGDGIVFHHDRYRLNPGLVSGSDVAELEAELAAAGAAGDDPLARLAHLERARSLIRGEYLDDCPFYGDSSQVEERRDLLRGQWVDILVSLGEQYEGRGDRPAAAACFREARQVSGAELPTADAALTRLGSTA